MTYYYYKKMYKKYELLEKFHAYADNIILFL